MILTTRVYAGHERIDYTYNPSTEVHGVYFVDSSRRSVRGDAAEVFGAISEFKENSDIRELMTWLLTL